MDHDLKERPRAKQCSVCRGSDHISVDCPVLLGKHRRDHLENLKKPKDNKEKVGGDNPLLKAKKEPQESTVQLQNIPIRKPDSERLKSVKEKDKKKFLQESQAQLQNTIAHGECFEKRETKKEKALPQKPVEKEYPATTQNCVPESFTKGVSSINKGPAPKLKSAANSQYDDSSQEPNQAADMKPTNFIRRLTSTKNSPIVPPKRPLQLEKDVSDSSPSLTVRRRPTPRAGRGQIRITYTPPKTEELMEKKKKQQIPKVDNAVGEASSSDSEREEDRDYELKGTKMRSKISPAKGKVQKLPANTQDISSAPEPNFEREEDSGDEEPMVAKFRGKALPVKAKNARSPKTAILVRTNNTSSKSESSSEYEDSDDEKLEFTNIRNKISPVTRGVRKSLRTRTQVGAYESSSSCESGSESDIEKSKYAAILRPGMSVGKTNVLLTDPDSKIEDSKPNKPSRILPPFAKKETHVLSPTAKKETPVPPPKPLASRVAFRPASATKPSPTPKTGTQGPAANLSTAPSDKKETPIPPPPRTISGATPPTRIKESLAKINSAIKASRQNDQILPSSLAGTNGGSGKVKKIGDSQEEKSLRVISDDWETSHGRVRGKVGSDDADVQESMY